MRQHFSIRGFSLIELMISLAIGTIVGLAIIQVMVSNRVTNQFNQTVAEVQESGRYIVTRIKKELWETGLYDTLYTQIALGVDVLSEEAFVKNHPVILANQFAALPALTSVNGAGTANDEIVISLQSETDCTGGRYGAVVGQHQHMVNHYFVLNNQLQCRGYSGRALRGIGGGTSSSGTVILMDDVKSFQVQYGISASAGIATGGAVQYVTADQLAAAEAQNRMVVSVRIGVLLQSQGSLSTLEDKTHTVLDVTGLSVDSKHYGQVFTHTIALRNMKNFARSI